MLRPALVPLGLASLAMLVLRMQLSGMLSHAPGIRRYELAALAGFALIPFAAVPISTLGGHYWIRYSVTCAIGLAGLSGVALFSIGRTNRLSGVTVMVIFGIYFTAGRFLPESARTDGDITIVNSSEEIQPVLDGIPSDAPIVIGPPMTFVELEHYSSPQLVGRLYYLAEPAAAEAIDGDTSFEVKGQLLSRFFSFRAHFADYHAFIATHHRFYVLRPIRNIVREYLAGRISLQSRETTQHLQYYEATTR
jgi:hypothetical protein